MKKFILLFLVIALTPLLAHAQTFTPDQPEGRGVYLFLSPNINGVNSSGEGWMIMSGEEVRVERLDYNGWAKVLYTNKDGKEIDGFLRIRSLKPLDDAAQEMLALAESRADLETRVLTIGLILAAAGLVLSFLPLGKMGLILRIVAFLGLCALEIWFLRTTGGFTIYSPSVYTWKTAIKWALCFIVFLAVQLKLWTGILNIFSDGRFIDGIVITMVLSLFVFVALLATVFLVPSNQLDTWFWRVYYVYLTLNLIQVIYNFKQFGLIRGLFFNVFLMIGLYAITLMAVDMVVVAIIGILAGSFLSFILGKFSQGAFSRVEVTDASGKKVTRWADGLKKGDKKIWF